MRCFLRINGKLYKKGNDFITVPENYNNKLLRLNNQLVKTDTSVVGSNRSTAPVPGLYDENDNLIKTWDELVAKGLVIVSE